MRDWVTLGAQKSGVAVCQPARRRAASRPEASVSCLWKDRQYASHRRQLDPSTLQPGGVPTTRTIPARRGRGPTQPMPKTVTDPVDAELSVPQDETARAPYLAAFDTLLQRVSRRVLHRRAGPHVRGRSGRQGPSADRRAAQLHGLLPRRHAPDGTDARRQAARGTGTASGWISIWSPLSRSGCTWNSSCMSAPRPEPSTTRNSTLRAPKTRTPPRTPRSSGWPTLYLAKARKNGGEAADLAGDRRPFQVGLDQYPRHGKSASGRRTAHRKALRGLCAQPRVPPSPDHAGAGRHRGVLPGAAPQGGLDARGRHPRQSSSAF